MKFQHLFTADAHCLRCSGRLRCFRLRGPDAWFPDKEPIEGVCVCACRRVGGKKREASCISFFVGTFFFLYFVVPGRRFCSSLLFIAFPFSSFRFLQRPFYTKKLVQTDAFTQTLLFTNPFTLRHRYTQTG